MDKTRATPGLHEALAYLDSLRAGDLAPKADVPEDDEDASYDTLDALVDQQDAKPLRPSPDEALTAIAIMRLCHATESAGPDLLCSLSHLTRRGTGSRGDTRIFGDDYPCRSLRS